MMAVGVTVITEVIFLLIRIPLVSNNFKDDNLLQFIFISFLLHMIIFRDFYTMYFYNITLSNSLLQFYSDYHPQCVPLPTS